jgi:hypothetical protein
LSFRLPLSLPPAGPVAFTLTVSSLPLRALLSRFRSFSILLTDFFWFSNRSLTVFVLPALSETSFASSR